tara:strand:+ start:1124 stop:1534 length:411 start_codon:yes stop_codon:yes gene_type:complete
MIKWLFSNPKFSEATNKEILDKLLNHIITFIRENNELYITNEYSPLKIDFYNFIYHNNSIIIENNEKFDIFTMKYSSCISDLYIHLKEITKSYNLDIFRNSQNNSYDLLCFIFQCTDFDYLNDENDINEDDMDEYN